MIEKNSSSVALNTKPRLHFHPCALADCFSAAFSNLFSSACFIRKSVDGQQLTYNAPHHRAAQFAATVHAGVSRPFARYSSSTKSTAITSWPFPFAESTTYSSVSPTRRLSSSSRVFLSTCAFRKLKEKVESVPSLELAEIASCNSESV